MSSSIFLAVALIFFGLILFTPFAKTTLWRATVTPLASIIGSGFLVSAPLLAKEFGGFAALVVALLIIFAGFIGGHYDTISKSSKGCCSKAKMKL